MAEKTETKTEPKAVEKDELRVVTFEGLQESHGDEAADIYSQISQIGGWGDDGANWIGGRQPRDIHGLRVIAGDARNPTLAADAKHRLSAIEKLLK